jgi:tetratricopeptide (TPR) repeat protein
MFNIGQAYRKSGHLEEALAKYREYLEKDPDAERGKIDDLIRDVEKKLGKAPARTTSSR